MAEHDDFGIHAFGRVMHGLHASNRVIERHGRRFDADRSRYGRVHVRDHHIGARTRKALRRVFIEHVRTCQHPELVGGCDHVHLELDAHPRLLEDLPELPVDEAHGGKVLHAVESHALQLGQEDAHQAEGIGAAHARQHRGVLYHRQHLARHVHDDRVRVTIRHHPGRAATPSHPETPGIVDDDEVDAAPLGELGRDPRSRAGANDGSAGIHLRTETPYTLRVRYEGHGLVRLGRGGAPEVHPPARAQTRRH